MKRFILAMLIVMSFGLQSFAVDSSQLAHSGSGLHKISLEEAMNMALKGNIELQEQRKNLGISQNDIKIANALRNPQAQSNIYMGPIGKGNSSQVGVMLPIEISKRGVRKKAAQAELSYTENKIKDYEFKLRLRVRTSYFNLLVAKSELRILKERKELLEDLLEIAKSRPKDSPNYEIDVLQADMRLKKQLIQINRSEAEIRTAQYNFNRVLNLANDSTLYDAKEDSIFSKDTKEYRTCMLQADMLSLTTGLPVPMSVQGLIFLLCICILLKSKMQNWNMKKRSLNIIRLLILQKMLFIQTMINL